MGLHEDVSMMDRDEGFYLLHNGNTSIMAKSTQIFSPPGGVRLVLHAPHVWD